MFGLAQCTNCSIRMAWLSVPASKLTGSNLRHCGNYWLSTPARGNYGYSSLRTAHQDVVISIKICLNLNPK